MKPTIDKSRVMKRAWSIFRGHNPYSGNFAGSLRRAWFVEKDSVRHEAQKAERERLAGSSVRPVVKLPVGGDFMEGAVEYYRNARRGVYFGD